MSQLPLPFLDPGAALRAPCAFEREEKFGILDGDTPPEEEMFEAPVTQRPAATPQAPWPNRSTQSPFAGVWPAALTWEAALAYTSLSPLQLRRFQKLGVISARRAGRNGTRIFLRSDLDQLLSTLFTPASVNIEEDFDFG